jgi:hypothetical protein
MGRIQRRRRARCRLRCEIALAGRRRKQGRLVTLSEGGFAVVADLDLEQGDPIRLLVHPGAGASPVKVSGIVWNDIAADGGSGRSRLRRLGCVVSDPSRSFLELLDRLAPKPVQSERVAIPVARPRARVADVAEPDLPRSRDPQPPPKPEPDESLPFFRVRMKQIGGPRTRILTLRARSANQAEHLAHEELAQVVSGAEGWVILHIARVARP